MPPFVIFAAAGVAAVAGYRFVKREMKRVEESLSSLRAGAEEAVPLRNGGTLVRGPDGVYRPADR